MDNCYESAGGDVIWLRHRRIDILCEVILAGLLIFMCYGAASAFVLQVPPSQDFLNGVFTEDIKGLASRIDHIETLINYVLTAIVGTLIVQMLQIRMHMARRTQDQATLIVPDKRY